MIVFKEKPYSKFDKIKEGISKSKNLLNETAWGLKLNPRTTVRKGVVNGSAWAIENPDLAVVNVAAPIAQYAALSKISPAIATASLTPGVPGIGTLYTAARVKSGSPKIMKKAGDAIRNSEGYKEAIDTALGKQPKAYLGLPSRQSVWDRIKYNIKSGVADISEGIQGAGKSTIKMMQRSASDVKGNNMKIFKEKQYTLQEGYYTGPKDLEDGVPGAIKVVGGSTLAGYGLGAIADKVTEDSRKPVLGSEPTSWSTRGAQAGFVAGVMSKILLNTMHNPMTTVKFQELDKALRRSFGMYRVSGITIGDSRENRNKMKETFVINSDKVTDFKINVSIVKGKLVMYTLALSEAQETELNEILDYYCKKYYGMKYTSGRIGKKSGSWSIHIVFTNHQIAANFLIEVAEELGVKINIMNAEISDEQMKSFSWVPRLDRVELKNIFSKGLLRFVTSKSPYDSGALLDMIIEGLTAATASERASMGIPDKRDAYGNKFLETTLKKLDPSGRKWTVGENGNNLNIYLFSGTLMVCASAGSKEESLLKKVQGLTETKKANSSSASFWTYKMKSPGDLETILRKIMSLGVPVNLYLS